MFIAFYVYTTTLWLCPPSDMKVVLLTPVRDVFNYTGLWQGFGVFGPQPRKQNFHVTANIYYADGRKGEWAFPRVDQMNHWDKLFAEHSRQYSIEFLTWQQNAFLWEPFSEWLLKQQQKQGLHPVKIELVKHWAYTPPPSEGLGKPAVPHSNVGVVYTYYVPKEKLALSAPLQKTNFQKLPKETKQ